MARTSFVIGGLLIFLALVSIGALTLSVINTINLSDSTTSKHRPCQPAYTRCNKTCVSLASNFDNCGTCGNVCLVTNATSGECANGECEVCVPPLANCEETREAGCNINVINDVNHCGACGNACFANQTCDDATCLSTLTITLTFVPASVDHLQNSSETFSFHNNDPNNEIVVTWGTTLIPNVFGAIYTTVQVNDCAWTLEPSVPSTLAAVSAVIPAASICTLSVDVSSIFQNIGTISSEIVDATCVGPRCSGTYSSNLVFLDFT
jgi:hypothetical protein